MAGTKTLDDLPTFQADWKNAGGDTVQAELQDWYDSFYGWSYSNRTKRGLRPLFCGKSQIRTEEFSMDKRPNILWHCTDQQRWDTIHALGNSLIRPTWTACAARVSLSPIHTAITPSAHPAATVSWQGGTAPTLQRSCGRPHGLAEKAVSFIRERGSVKSNSQIREALIHSARAGGERFFPAEGSKNGGMLYVFPVL